MGKRQHSPAVAVYPRCKMHYESRQNGTYIAYRSLVNLVYACINIQFRNIVGVSGKGAEIELSTTEKRFLPMRPPARPSAKPTPGSTMQQPE